MRAQVVTFAGCLIPSQFARSQATKKTIFTCVYIEKKIFSRTSRPIPMKLSVNHAWAKGILNCSNKGPIPLQRGDNYNNAKMG
jgi:hypothetical protein